MNPHESYRLVRFGVRLGVHAHGCRLDGAAVGRLLDHLARGVEFMSFDADQREEDQEIALLVLSVMEGPSDE